MVKSTICVNHIVRPDVHITVEGTGDCTTCTPDENNCKCKNFSPIGFFIDEIKGERND